MGSLADRVLHQVIPLVYARRRLTFGLLIALTAWMLSMALRLQPDAGFEKQIPLAHPYMQVFKQYEQAFGGANLISIAVIDHRGEIYNERFLETLRKVTDEVFFLPGVDRSRVTSLFTPGVRYIEIVEGGFASGDVVPRDYQPTSEMLALIRSNVAKADIIGRLVSLDQHGALVVAELLEHDPSTGQKLDYHKVAQALESIRTRFEGYGLSIHVIGFAKVVGDVTDASLEVIGFFAIALLSTLLLLWLFCGSLRLALLPLGAAISAVIWELGLLKLTGFGLDPFAILVPFLILSIGVSHGVQYINSWSHEVAENGRNALDASLETFRRLFIPGTVAIVTDVLGFATLMFIQIDIVREMALNAVMGMAAVIITNKVMLPIVLSWVHLPDVAGFRRRAHRRIELTDRWWHTLSAFATRGPALGVIAVAVTALAWALYMYPRLTIGDQQVGVPELRADSRYNRDSRTISENFAVGVDLLKVLAVSGEYGCIDPANMTLIDRFAWHLQNTQGVQSVLSLPQLARQVRVAWFDGSPKWRVLPRNQGAMAELVAPVPTSMGLNNPDCSVMPVLIFLRDHRAETIQRVVDVVERFQRDNAAARVDFKLASGNVGVMAATNAEIRDRELLVIIWVHMTLALFAWLSFRTLCAVFCILTPLVLCSLLTYGLMASLGIGMKPATLPVAAFGVGIGVDYSIYLWSVLASQLAQRDTLRHAYFEALRHTGKAVIFTSASLLLSVFTWLFSSLQFQADMGLLLLFMFSTNLIGAILLLPALAWLVVRSPGTTSTRSA
ncbi:RND family transporter [Sinimarinibacterium sp. CAU 1509]|uniref:efflux RND transporter permease subunit n=1 Tax=Sinimarinibacterium sp. CAU 1509 TaxID=2562283 RepID=UPI0010AC6637|nr:MMPL family transporter [Sinimarinibacterium sp. CAU 1509]TJY60802.1 RND family transporter [Sinimarinibacterium sp. CAU 1509]